jgi:hypothetical protein
MMTTKTSNGRQCDEILCLITVRLILDKCRENTYMLNNQKISMLIVLKGEHAHTC